MSTVRLAASLLLPALLLLGCSTTPPVPASELAGIWRQDDAECGLTISIRELEFRPDGSFSVTWRPFETYRDYWGEWRLDEQTRMLELVILRGNHRPADFAGRGRITLSEGALELGEISLGSPSYGARCTAPFRRRPAS